MRWFMKLLPEKNGNGISEALKIKIFWWSMLPHPPRGSRLRRSFHYALLCVPKRKNHATPLDCQYWAPNVVAKVKKGKKEDEMSLFTLMLSLRTVWKLWWISEILSVPLRKFMWICQKKRLMFPQSGRGEQTSSFVKLWAPNTGPLWVTLQFPRIVRTIPVDYSRWCKIHHFSLSINIRIMTLVRSSLQMISTGACRDDCKQSDHHLSFFLSARAGGIL